MVDDYGADDQADDGVFHVWPAFVDLLAATSLLFISLVAAFIFVSNTEIGEAITQRRQLIRALKSVGGADSLYAIRDDAQFVRITVQADATFPFTEWRLASLRPAGKQALDSIGGILKRESIESLYRQVRILGHTDQVPFVDNSSSNWELSAARAAVVAGLRRAAFTVAPANGDESPNRDRGRTGPVARRRGGPTLFSAR